MEKARTLGDKILHTLMKDFEDYKDLPNQEYLEAQLSRLYQMKTIYKTQSTNVELSARQRAKARDQEQRSLGLINGIKFAISFWLHENEDLLKLEPDAPGAQVNAREGETH